MKRKVLFLGNGLNRSYNSQSWSDLLQLLNGGVSFNSDLPMSLQAILVTRNDFNNLLKEYTKELEGEVNNLEYRRELRRILSAGFDDIITTNYSYELEIASLNKTRINFKTLNKMRKHTDYVDRAESINLLSTYNEVKYKGNSTRVWHIHGEARNTNSIVIGHEYYGRLLSKYTLYLKHLENDHKKTEHKLKMKNQINSWIDLFMMSDVYVLGFGFHPSEMDLWYLLSRKKTMDIKNKGKMIYFCPEWDRKEKSETFSLLRLFDVGIGRVDEEIKEKDYKEFYFQALNQIIEDH